MPSEVRFTRVQRWDLIRISAAAVASTVFFTVPMFFVRPQPVPAHTQDREDSSQPRDFVLASLSQTTRSSESPSGAMRVTADDTIAVSVVTATEVAQVTTPALQNATTARTRNGRPADLRARANTPPAPPSLSRRVARFIAGTGKYIVKPFPTVNTSGS